MNNFNPLKFIAGNTGLSLADAIKKAYEQGKKDAEPQNDLIEYTRAYNVGYKIGKKDVQSDNKEKILQCISELEENSKYHAAFIQRNTKFIIEGLRMALDFMKDGEEHD